MAVEGIAGSGFDDSLYETDGRPTVVGVSSGQFCILFDTTLAAADIPCCSIPNIPFGSSLFWVNLDSDSSR